LPGIVARAKSAESSYSSSSSSSILVLLLIGLAAVAVIPLASTFGQAQSELTVTAVNTGGGPAEGMQTTLLNASGGVVGTSLTPASFTLDNG
jgi:hypothetical protein